MITTSRVWSLRRDFLARMHQKATKEPRKRVKNSMLEGPKTRGNNKFRYLRAPIISKQTQESILHTDLWLGCGESVENRLLSWTKECMKKTMHKSPDWSSRGQSQAFITIGYFMSWFQSWQLLKAMLFALSSCQPVQTCGGPHAACPWV
jgi:hypothetical protein